MSHQVILEYTETLLRQTVYAFWRRSLGVWYWVVWSLLSFYFVYLCRGDNSWEVGALGAILILGLALPILIYFVHLRNGLAKFRAMGEPTVELNLEDETFTIKSGIGASSLKWSVVTEVWRFPSFWLLMFSKSQFITIPLATVPLEAQQFILNHVSANGGKIG
jgi:YcxB-like protein